MAILKLAFEYIPCRLKLICYVLITLLLSACTLLLPFLQSNVISLLTAGITPLQLLWHGLFILSLNITSQVLGYFGEITNTKLRNSTSNSLNCAIIDHLKKADIEDFGKQDVGYLSNRIYTDVNTIVLFSLQVWSSALVMIIRSTAIVILLTMLNPLLTLLCAFLCVVYAMGFLILKKPLFRVAAENREAHSLYYSGLQEQIRNTKFIKAHSLFSFFADRILQTFTKYSESNLKYTRFAYMTSSYEGFVSGIAQTAILIWTGVEVINGVYPVGIFIVISSYFSNLLASISFAFRLAKNHEDARVAYHRITKLMNVQKDENGDIEVPMVHSISLCDISVGFGNLSLINSLTYSFNKGKIYCVMGPNGAGKSTLFSLLLGMKNDQKGITINSIPFSSIDKISYRAKNIGYVEQHPIILNDTIANNILFDRIKESDLTEEQMEFIDEFVVRKIHGAYNLGINTPVTIAGIDANISGGEAQKITLLRELLKDPEVLLLDEPTSSLDNTSIDWLCNWLQKGKDSKITIIITHDKRLTAIADETINLAKNSVSI